MSQSPSKLTIPLEEAFDFWIGNWEVSWINQEGNKVIGTNVITKTLDGKVIQENFEDPASGFKGTSISVLDSKDTTWKQTWADNSGGYIEFYGVVDDEIRVFQTKEKTIDNKTFVMRMVFSNINKDNFEWVWERSDDHGKTWQAQWKIDYKRLK